MNRAYLLLSLAFFCFSGAAWSDPPGKPAGLLTLSGETVFVVSPDEPEALRRAVRDVRNDWYKVMGRLPTMLESPPEKKTWNGPLVYLGLKAPWLKELYRTPFAGPECFALVAAQDSRGNPAVVATGADVRGAIYAAYALSEELLGIDPWYYWVDRQPPYRGRIDVPADYHRTWGPPTFKYRGFFINDEDLLNWFSPDPLGENVFSLSMWDRVYELILRLRGNTIIPGTFPFPDERSAELASRRGLVNSQHHILVAGLNTYHYPNPKEYSYTNHPDVLEKHWSTCIDVLKRYETVWTVGFRGMHDRPFWWDEPSVATPEARAKVISRAIAAQVKLIRRAQPNADIITNLWWEGADLWHAGLLDLPEDVIVVWPDDGTGTIRDRGRVAAGHGIYYHTAMVNGQANQLSEMVPPGRIHHEISRFVRAGATSYLVVNTSDIRPVPLTTDYVMRLAWDASEEIEKTDIQAMQDCLLRFSQRQFGEKAAPALAAIYHDYFMLPYLRKARRADCGLMRSVRTTAQSLAEWARDGKTPDPKALDGVRKNVPVFAAHQERFEKLFARAAALGGDVPADRREFYQFHVLTTMEFYRQGFAAAEQISRAMLAMAEGDRESAMRFAREAVSRFDGVGPALRKAEYTPWQGWYAGDLIARVEPTRYALAVAAAALAGESPPSPVPLYDPYKKIQEYQRPFLENYPLMYPKRRD